ncbi:MAG: hypothetical protein CHACPFDD_00519 [Phycisphaerae bacterium]|nr:hypothetical protein [Phycisphaerae bacterium]
MSEAPASTGIGLAARDGVSAGAARTSARYYVCVGVLLVCALTMQTVAQLLGNHFRKAAVPLKRPLAAMDRYKLAPEYTLHIEPPAALPEEMIEWLGTREYLSWRVVDTRHDRADAVNTAHLFITYYTGKPDMVPHVPDECYLAGGYDCLSAETIEVPVPEVGAPRDRVGVRLLGFVPSGATLRGQNPHDAATHVMYFFLCNGRYAVTRDEVRLIQANLFDKYAYYAKIEIRFTDYSMRRQADRQASAEAVGPLLRKILPLLLKDHVADWNELNARGTAVPPA